MTWLFGTRGGSGRALSRPLLAAAARRVWGLEALPPLIRGERGKPFFLRRPELQFSLSHSGGLALCALSARPVGVDVELLRPRSRALLERGLTDRELAWCLAQADPWRRFYTLWTRRESLGKCTGRGLTLPVREMAVPLPPAGQAEGLWFQSYQGPDWTASVCGEEVPPGELIWLTPAQLEAPAADREG